MATEVAQSLLQPAIDMLEQFGFKWWLSTEDLPDLSVVAEVPQVWVERGPTDRELTEFFRLHQAGKVEEAQAFAQTGFPDYMR